MRVSSEIKWTDCSDLHSVAGVATPGYSQFVYGWAGQSWPECECDTSVTCRLEGAAGPAVYTTRYAYQVPPQRQTCIWLCIV